MCRVFGVLAQHPVPVARAFRALQAQSKEHKDGWGVVRFGGDGMHVERGLEPAWQSDPFARLGDTLQPRALLAHIRLASVGPVTLENNHPFVDDAWAFVHNGTVKNFEAHQGELESLLPTPRRHLLRGQTESERCFHLFRTFLDEERRQRPSKAHAAAAALARTLATVRRLCDGDAPKPASLNFLASNGQVMAATRHGRSLWLCAREGERVIASEQLWGGPGWEELQEGEVVAVDEQLAVQRWPLEALT